MLASTVLPLHFQSAYWTHLPFVIWFMNSVFSRKRTKEWKWRKPTILAMTKRNNAMNWLAGYGQSIVFINTFLLCVLIISMSWILEFTLSHIKIGPDSIYSIKVLLCPAYAACNFILEYGAAFLFRLNSYIVRFLSHEPLTFSRSRSFSNIFPLYCLRKCWSFTVGTMSKVVHWNVTTKFPNAFAIRNQLI